uniref:Small ribosomal subunit protein uS3c n=1 Tax=Cryptomonas sp. CCAC 1634B TaxID=2051848 RepID=A0A679CAD7_9CRYP|nr:ribosomal protein S3 [Cryptomonas sp. CCAC 1634B]
MGQKTHPLGFRLGITQTHRSSWFEPKQSYSSILEEDYNIRKYLEKNLSATGMSRIEICRTSTQVDIVVFTSRPGMVIGNLGLGVESLREGLQSLLSYGRRLRICVEEVTNPDSEAFLIAESVAQQLEKRSPFRKVTRQAVTKAQKGGIQGIKIQVSGRLNGAEIARTEWIREGRLPLQTLRANIDYATYRAYTTYGVLGVKVWIFKGERLRNSKVSSTSQNL